MKKKILSIMLTLAICVTFTPLEIFAIEEEAAVHDPTSSVTFNDDKCDITLEWQGSAESFDVYDVSNGSSKVATTDQKTYTIQNKNVGEVYKYEVVEKEQSVTGTPLVVVADELTATVDGLTVNLSWKKQGSFIIYDNGEVIDNVSNKKVYTADDVTVGEHTFEIKKTNDSDYVCSATVVVKPIAPVTGLNTVSGNQNIVVRWNAVDDVDSYRVFRNGALIADTTATSIADWIGTDASAGYTVCAVKNGVCGEMSAPVYDEVIRTMYYTIKFKKAKKLKSHAGPKQSVNFPKNFTATAVEFRKGQYRFWYNGSLFYVNRIRVKASVGTYSDVTYSPEEAEYYINSLGLSSKTPYFIWVNAYTQQEYIFTGSTNNWHCIASWDISTGKPSTPSATGSTKIKSKTKKRHGIKYWNVCSVYSIHSKKNSWKLGWPRSGGCIRNTEDHAKWIYDNCKKKTGVYLF